jgi:hypothetical protein
VSDDRENAYLSETDERERDHRVSERRSMSEWEREWVSERRWVREQSESRWVKEEWERDKQKCWWEKSESVREEWEVSEKELKIKQKIVYLGTVCGEQWSGVWCIYNLVLE